MPREFRPNFMATGIGSLPHGDPDTAVIDVASRLTEMPYWPQLPAYSAAEDMNLQYASALEPLVVADTSAREAKAHPGMGREDALAAFYERLYGGSLEQFGLNQESAAGFFRFMDHVGQAAGGAYPWIKGHVTGPLTQGAAVMGADGKAMLYDDEAADAVARGLGAAAAAQVAQMKPLGRGVMIFFDEPFLSGYGSAFTPINRDRAIALLALSIQGLREHEPDVIIGIHCCGNTDWALLVEAGADVINLDSAGFGQHLLLYPEAVDGLLRRGGAVAWGAVPTSEYTGNETAQGLWEHTLSLLQGLEAKGLDRELLASQAMITPACGLGSLDPDKARAILDLTAAVSDLARKNYA